MFNIPNVVLDEFLEPVISFLGIYMGFMGITFLVQIALFVLNGLGIYKMSQKLNISAGWLGFIPVVSVFATGRVAEKYQKRDGKSSAKLSIWLLITYIAALICAAVLVVLTISFVLSLVGVAFDAVSNGTDMEMADFAGIIPVIVMTFLTIAVEIAYAIIYYISLWRTFSIFDSGNATLYLVLSIFFGFLAPIFTFIIRNKEPKLTYNERMGYISYEPEREEVTPIE